jgi:hypothetical protein
MLRAMIGSSTAIADIVPVDVCVNMMIAIALLFLVHRIFQYIIVVLGIWVH